MPQSLATSLRACEVVVCCGAGGVGKTTLSAALGIRMAADEDMRVLVLTVDPARRLATALGMEEIGDEPVRVPPARLRRAGLPLRGELSAAMLDAKSAWDRVVHRYAPSEEVAARILRNRFYQGISESFIGSHEYMVMETLYDLHASHEFDCVVVDTPPSRSALDFLEAPANLADFIGGRLISLLAGGSRIGFGALNLAARPVMSIADRLLGADVLHELAQFASDLQELYGGIEKRSRQVGRLMRSDAVGFVVITTLEQQAFTEAEFFASRLRASSMPLRAIIVNRVLPDVFEDESAQRFAVALTEEDALPPWLGRQLGERVSAATANHLGESFLAYNRLARRDAQQRARLARMGRVPVATVPLHGETESEIQGLVRIASELG